MPKDSHKEGRLLLAINAIKIDQIKSVRKAAEMYDVPRSTLQDRLQGSISQPDNSQHKCKLTSTEENILVQWILSIKKCGAPLRLSIV